VHAEALLRVLLDDPPAADLTRARPVQFPLRLHTSFDWHLHQSRYGGGVNLL